MSDAALAAAVLALDPAGVGGVCLRGPAGPERAAWMEALQAMMAGAVARVPAGVEPERLLGGTDLVATLAHGAARRRQGLLEDAAGGVLVMAMAERQPVGVSALVAQGMDGGGFGVVLLDEGMEEERPAGCLLERAGMVVSPDRAGVTVRELGAARQRLVRVEAGDEAVATLCTVAAALGVGSMRAPLLALRVARAAAALDGRLTVGEQDLALASRLVLTPRATQVPDMPREAQPESEAPDDGAPEPGKPEPGEAGDADAGDAGQLAERVVQSARAALPADVLAGLARQGLARVRAGTEGRAAAKGQGGRGRRLAARRGQPRGGARLDLMATLLAAAPWQGLRGGAPPVRLRMDDLRVRRRERRAASVTIFLVDASGSAAMHRLAEAKGAVERLLAECYVRRDQVAVVAFRGQGAQVVLPPTRSLVRAKRGLAGLPGGGGTPLAAGLEAGLALADGVRRRGMVPGLVLLTDGQANVGRDGRGGRAQARADAEAAAKGVRAAGLACLVIDTAPRPGPAARSLADAAGGRYLPLPQADAALRGLA